MEKSLNIKKKLLGDEYHKNLIKDYALLGNFI